MIHRLKTLLTVLLLALLPLQGFAMAAAPGCVQAQHDRGSTSAQQVFEHCHASTQDHQQATHLHGCDGCAICHAVFAAMPASIGFIPHLQALRLQTRTTSLLFYGHTPAVPERPPRLMIV